MKSGTIPLAALAALTLTGPATAAILLNAGFEADAITTNNFINSTPVNWIGYGNTVGHYVGDGSVFSGISGAQSVDQYFLAYVTGNNYSQIRQDSDLQWSDTTVGATLTFSAYTNYRDDPTANGASAYFWLNDTDAADNLGLNSAPINVGDAAQGTWTLRTWTYTITQSIRDTAIADNWGAVELGLGIIGGGGGDQQVAFDNVSLVYTPIPEPRAALLGGLGLLALLRRRR